MCAYNFDVDFDFANSEPWDENEDRHAKDKPEVLLEDKVLATGIPLLGVGVVDITEDDEHPCTEKTQPVKE